MTIFASRYFIINIFFLLIINPGRIFTTNPGLFD